jgi:hypothetical protein
MNSHILNLIHDLGNEINELKSILEGMNDNDLVGINVAKSLIAEKKKTIERLEKIK